MLPLRAFLHPLTPATRSPKFAPIHFAKVWGVTTNGAFQLAFMGATGASYRVWASTNFLTWEVLGTAASPSAGQYLFLDATVPSSPERFYRATAP